jgi:predicted P-loop ATPase
MDLSDAAAELRSASLAPIRVWGARAGTCTCPRGAQCTSPGKHPIARGWQALETPESFDAHEGNIGLAIGPGHVVVDVDGPQGAETLRDFSVPRTWLAITGSGAHYWFRLAPHQAVKNGVKLLPGIDVRASGGFVVAPPSVHANGIAYAWTVPPTEECAVLPDALYAALFPPVTAPIRRAPKAKRSTLPATDREERCRRYVATMPPAISGQGGHRAAFCVARVIVQDFGMTGSTAEQLFAEYNARCDPPWSNEDIAHKLRDAERARIQVEKGVSVPRVESCGTAAPAVDWRAELHTKGNAQLQPTEHNLVVIMSACSRFEGKIRYNEFTSEIELLGVDLGPRLGGVRSGRLEDADVARLVAWFQAAPDAEGGAGKFADKAISNAIEIVARTNTHHPIRDWLSGLQWDKRQRIDTWLTEFAGAECTLYTRSISRKFLISAVARIMRPGCKVDTTLILEGAQGALKSTLIETLFGARYTQTSKIEIGEKDGAISTLGKWAIELAELEGIRGRAASATKAFLSLSHDSYRPPYGRTTVTVPRQCVFVGSTNEDEYLTDDTGARRFWPVKVTDLDLAGIAHHRDQIWAEAVDAYRTGETWWLAKGAEVTAAAEATADRHADDPWRTALAASLPPSPVTTAYVLTTLLGVDVAKQTRADQMRVGSILRSFGRLRRRAERKGILIWEYHK